MEAANGVGQATNWELGTRVGWATDWIPDCADGNLWHWEAESLWARQGGLCGAGHL